MIRYCGRIRTSPFLCIPSFTSFSFASVCPRHSPDVFPAFSRPFLSLSAAVGVFAQGCRHLCARKFPFMRKGVGVLAQECGGPCSRPPESVRRPLRHAVPSLRARRDACSPVSRRQRCPAVPSLRVRAVAAVPWRGFPPAVSRPRAVSAGELLPAVRGCPRVLFRSSGKNAVA